MAVATTLGLHAPRLDAVRALQTKRGRREAARYAVEGPTMLAEALAAGLEPEALYVTQRGAAEFGSLALPYDERLFVVPDRAMERLSDVETPAGILAIFPIVLEDIVPLLADGEPVAVLAGVSDPGNAGTLLRTAEIFGITRALFSGDAVEPHNPKVVRATMGALFRMRIGVAGPSELVESAARAGYTIVAAARGGEPLPGFRFATRTLIAIGSERHGVDHVLPRYDRAVSIPHIGEGESLNAAVAGAIIFYAFSQQSERRIHGPETSKKR